VRPWNQTDLNMVPGADPHYAQEALAQ